MELISFLILELKSQKDQLMSHSISRYPAQWYMSVRMRTQTSIQSETRNSYVIVVSEIRTV